MIAGDWSWPTSTGSAQVPPLAWRRAPPRPNGRASPPSSPHDVNDSVDTMWEYPGISHVRSFKNLPPYPGFVLMIIVFQKESLVPPKWWPGWLASNLRSSALRAALWAWRSNAKWGTSSARSQSGLGSSAGNFGGARWDKLQLSARNLKFQHVSTCFNLSIFQYSPCHSFTILSRALSRPMSCMSFWLCLSPSWNNNIHYYPWRPKTASSPLQNIQNDYARSTVRSLPNLDIPKSHASENDSPH